jgi:adenine-specific DNA-methyltransferase
VAADGVAGRGHSQRGLRLPVAVDIKVANDLQNLLARVEKTDPALAAELGRRVSALSKRREFGLNFEKHLPETVELYGRQIRVGDKVRFLAEREVVEAVRRDTWIVQRVRGSDADVIAELVLEDSDEKAERRLSDLVVVADFRDPIYPGLRSTGGVSRGGNKPFHAVINAENYHALEALLFTCQGSVDAIYIDPPYNTRDKDWKYNNDYVDSDDDYKHSKWLSFMERRLKLARKLLNPENSVLIVTIDEKEVHRLGLLLYQVFPSARIQMVSLLINPANVPRRGAFGRNDEYAFFVMMGAAAPQPVALGADWLSIKGRTFLGSVRWDLLRRSGTNAQRADRPKLFYPIFVDPKTNGVVDAGEPIALDAKPSTIRAPKKLVAVWPIRKDGTDGNWQLGPKALLKHVEEGRVRLGGSADKGYVVYYIKGGEYKKVLSGDYPVLGRNTDGSLKLGGSENEENRAVPGTQWHVAAHDSTQYGSRLLSTFVPGRRFPFPKSLYAVEDALRFFVADKPDALILDFFAGSGTTAHAVARLNSQDEGRRQSILITNNEVSNDEAAGLRKLGHRRGEPEWEVLGICEHITKPRITAAITGLTPNGVPLPGEYRFADEFPMADGFDENVEFFDITYEDPRLVALDMAFPAIAPLLWMRAGSQGRRIDDHADTYDIADTYAVLFNIDAIGPFLTAVEETPGLRVVYVVTDDEKQFQMLASSLPARLEAVRLYESYLRTFEINTGKD